MVTTQPRDISGIESLNVLRHGETHPARLGPYKRILLEELEYFEMPEQRYELIGAFVILYFLLTSSCQFDVAENGQRTTTSSIEIEPPDSSRYEFLERWTVTSWTQPGITALSAEEADMFIGMELFLGSTEISFDGRLIESITYVTKVDDFMKKYEDCRTRGGVGCDGIFEWHQAATACLDNKSASQEGNQLLAVVDNRGRQVERPSEFLRVGDILAMNLDGTYFCLMRD